MKPTKEELTCKRCGKEVEYKKELLDGVCFDCWEKYSAKVIAAGIEGWNFWLFRNSEKKWLKNLLQKGKTKEKYTGFKIQIPRSFYRHLKTDF